MKKFFTFVSLAICCATTHAQLIINEVMQSNIDCVMDDFNQFPDSWVEIYNATASSVNLKNYKIGITDDASTAWQLPDQTLAGRGYVLVYCDKEASGIHTNFRVDSGKDAAVYLFLNSTNEVVDKITGLAKQPAPNISYGRKTEISSEMGYQQTPTPAAENCGVICENVLGEPIFSKAGRVNENSSFNGTTVSISIPDGSPAGTIIRYTTDGTEPTATNGFTYSKEFSLYGTKVIRAKLMCDGYLSPRSTTQSYIALTRQMTLPVVSITTDSKYLTDNKVGILVDGTYNSKTKNYEYDWRRPLNFEYFAKAGQNAELNQLCEGRVTGGASRGCSLKSLGLYANKRFGEKHFKYEFFPDQRPGLKKYSSIMLRNAGNDFDYLYMRDAMAQRSMSMYQDIDWQAWSPAIVYINGVYKGILNIRERSNEDNIYTNYDGLEDIDMFENAELKEGDKENVNAFMAFYTEHGHTMAEYSEWMDMAEYVNIYILNAYFNNIDFPANNMVMWRPRTADGKWRWLAKDVDYILGIYNQQAYNYQYISWLNNNSFDTSYSWGNTYDATRLFRRLEEDADFKTYFTDRFAIYMGDFLNLDNTWKYVWQPMYEKIKTEYPYHRKLINEWWPNYSDELSSAKTWMNKRTAFMYTHLNDYYSVGTPETMTVNSGWTDAQHEAVDITFNDVTLSRGVFNGKFWNGRQVTLKGISKDGVTGVTGWKVTRVSSNGSKTESTIAGDTYTFTMPTCSKLMIMAFTGDLSAIENVQMDSADDDTVTGIYDINGIRRQSLKKGINIVRMKDGTTQKIRY